MKKLISLTTITLMMGCQSAVVETTNKSRPSTNQAMSLRFIDHYLKCRDKASDQTQRIVNRILAQPNMHGIILYFHGGLSGEKYVTNDLGPMLMNSLFSQENFKSYYPVFMGYDADPLEWESVKYQIKILTKDAAFKRAKDRFSRKIKRESAQMKMNISLHAEEGYAEAEVGQFYIDSAIASVNKSSAFAFKSLEEKNETYFRILKDDDFANKLEKKILSDHSEFADIQKDLQNVNAGQKENSEKALLISSTAKIIIRSLARFATQTHHDIVPTFEEEAFKVYKISSGSIQSLAANHWKMVKEHSKECFSEKSAGRFFIDALLAKNIPIHTISHSAGSIPTGQLLKYLSSNKNKIASVNLIVPAINQSDFTNLFIQNRASAEKIKGYILSENKETKDSIAFGLYPASLLYFVSGAADNAWYNDKMLMIDQHLRPTREIYANKYFQKITGEEPQAVWSYMAEEKNNWYFYPSKELPYETNDFGRRASHECTKYPWIATEVAKDIIYNITGKKFVNIPIPKVPKDPVRRANETCRSGT